MKKAKQVAKDAHRADRKLSRKAAEARDHLVVRAAAAVCELADQPPLIALSAGTAAVGAVLSKPRVARVGLRMLASHLLATGIKIAIKRSVDRTRPHAELRGKRYTLEKGGSHEHDLSSFPSGHTAGAVAVSCAVARDVPESAPLGAAASAMVAAVQLPNAKHYASDVAAGAVIGLVSEWLVSAAFDAIERRIAEVRPARS